ncbi:hypothetical protein H696_01258 [Fonticula alba]|uniref:Uncharacterized protein n=1 Tax=Fonticula alba TaxID=691883 RepID=A0A058ZD27_FONAL|nr:hypothetical protein H696_01258 [Fonticula alba]KCV71841.1 hypothetical protein H696_01258 [Fonticula alba]|eukprot:XP_009493419.1 hypothetical protein H696_01258 [Fonticula alba]
MTSHAPSSSGAPSGGLAPTAEPVQDPAVSGDSATAGATASTSATSSPIISSIDSYRREWTLPTKLTPAQKERFLRDTIAFCLANQVPWKPSAQNHFRAGSPAEYYAELLFRSRKNLMLYPHHLSHELATFVERSAPFAYYTHMLIDLLVEGRGYDSLPNFTATDCYHFLGIGRNEFIDIANRGRNILETGTLGELASPDEADDPATGPHQPASPGEQGASAHDADSWVQMDAGSDSESLPSRLGHWLRGIPQTTGALLDRLKGFSLSSKSDTHQREQLYLRLMPTTLSAGFSIQPWWRARPCFPVGVLDLSTPDQRRDYRVRAFLNQASAFPQAQDLLRELLLHEVQMHLQYRYFLGEKGPQSPLAAESNLLYRTGVTDPFTYDVAELVGFGNSGIIFPLHAACLPGEQLRFLLERGLVYLDVPITDNDKISVLLLRNFIMNRRVQSDAIENLLYQIFISIDDATSVFDLSDVLQIRAELIRNAVSVYCRLGLAEKIDPRDSLYTQFRHAAVSVPKSISALFQPAAPSPPGGLAGRTFGSALLQDFSQLLPARFSTALRPDTSLLLAQPDSFDSDLEEDDTGIGSARATSPLDSLSATSPRPITTARPTAGDSLVPADSLPLFHPGDFAGMLQSGDFPRAGSLPSAAGQIDFPPEVLSPVLPTPTLPSATMRPHSFFPLVLDAALSAAITSPAPGHSPRRRPRFGLLIDASVTAILMMGDPSGASRSSAFSPHTNLKSHAVTLYERGKIANVACDDFLNSLASTLLGEAWDAEAAEPAATPPGPDYTAPYLSSDLVPGTRTYYDHVLGLYKTLFLLRHGWCLALDPGLRQPASVDIIRIESLASLDPTSRRRVLARNYDVLVSTAPSPASLFRVFPLAEDQYHLQGLEEFDHISGGGSGWSLGCGAFVPYIGPPQLPARLRVGVEPGDSLLDPQSSVLGPDGTAARGSGAGQEPAARAALGPGPSGTASTAGTGVEYNTAGSATCWLSLFMYRSAGCGPASVALRTGTRLRRLPATLLPYDYLAVMVWSVAPQAAREGSPHDPLQAGHFLGGPFRGGVYGSGQQLPTPTAPGLMAGGYGRVTIIPRRRALTILNDLLLDTALLVQGVCIPPADEEPAVTDAAQSIEPVPPSGSGMRTRAPPAAVLSHGGALLHVPFPFDVPRLAKEYPVLAGTLVVRGGPPTGRGPTGAAAAAAAAAARAVPLLRLLSRSLYLERTAGYVTFCRDRLARHSDYLRVQRSMPGPRATFVWLPLMLQHGIPLADRDLAAACLARMAGSGVLGLAAAGVLDQCREAGSTGATPAPTTGDLSAVTALSPGVGAGDQPAPAAGAAAANVGVGVLDSMRLTQALVAFIHQECHPGTGATAPGPLADPFSSPLSAAAGAGLLAGGAPITTSFTRDSSLSPSAQLAFESGSLRRVGSP